MIIAFLGESLKHYRECFLVLLEKLELRCPYCSSLTHWHAWYKRSVKGELLPLSILRVKCCGCSSTHAVLPDLLSPYKQYSQIVQEEALQQVLEDGMGLEHVEFSAETEEAVQGPSVDTLRRWVRRHRQRCRHYLGALAAFLTRQGFAVGPWDEGFPGFRLLLSVAEAWAGQTLRGTSLFGKSNILLTIAQPRLWI